MSATKCGNVYAVVLPIPKVEPISPKLEEYDPALAWTDKSKSLLRKIRQKEPEYVPFTIKELYGKAYKMGLLDESD